MLGEPRDDRRRHVAAERRADLVHLLPLLAVQLPDPRQEDETSLEARNDRVEQDAVLGERVPADIAQGGDRREAQRRRPIDREERHQRRQRQRQRRARDEFRSRRPVGPLEGHARKDLLDELRMGFDAGRRRIERRRNDVGKTDGAGADEDQLAAEIGEIGAGLEGLPGGKRAARVGAGEPDAQIASPLRRDHDVADLDRVDRRALAGARAIGVGRLHHKARRALGDPQSLHSQARLDLAVDVEKQRHRADHAIVVRQPVEKAEPGRGVRQRRDRRERAVEVGQDGVRRLADEGKASFRDEPGVCGVGGRREERAENHRQPGNGVGEGDIPVRALLAVRGLVGAMRRRLRASLLVLARLILLGKKDVEADRGGVRFRQGVDQRRHRPSRPRPPADAPDRFVVDVDDPDRLIECVGSRPPALVLIEDEVLEVSPERREQAAERKHQGIGKDDDQQIGPPLPQLPKMCPYRAKPHQIDNRIPD